MSGTFILGGRAPSRPCFGIEDDVRWELISDQISATRKKMRVLVIEDDARLARQVTRELQRANHEATARNDGAEGLQVARENPPDLIVLDINLPGLDGFSVLAGLHAEHSTARILILTARGDVNDRAKGLKAGADDYFPRPISMNELMARIEARGGTHGHGLTKSGKLADGCAASARESPPANSSQVPANRPTPRWMMLIGQCLESAS